MKKFIYAFLAAVIFVSGILPVFAAPQLGITPCVISAQPADLSYSGTSASRRMSSCGETVIVYNNTANDVRYRLGSASNTTALLTDLLLPANSFVVLNVGLNQLYFAVISSGSGTISFVQGTAGT